MALKNGIQFKGISESFKNCEQSFNTFTERINDSKPNKKQKLDLDHRNKEIESNVQEKEIDAEEMENLRSTYILTMSQSLSANDGEDRCDEVVFESFSEMEDMDLTQFYETSKNNSHPTILIQAFKTVQGVALYKILEDTQPRFIIMYHSDVSVVRQIEVTNKRLSGI